MPTVMYLHNKKNDHSGQYPTAEQSASAADVTWSDARNLRTMNTIIGTAQVAPTASTLNQTAAQKHFVRMFTSPPLSGAQTVGGGTARFNCADAESNAQANHWIDGLNIYVWRPSTGVKVGTLVDTTDALGGLEPTAAASEQVTRFTFATTAISAADGDVVICEVWSTFSQGMAAINTVTFYFDGTTTNDTENAVVTNHASLLELAENLTFKTDPAANTTSFVDHFDQTGGIFDRSRWFISVNNGGQVFGTDSYAKGNYPANNDAGIFYYRTKISKTTSQLWLTAMSGFSGGVNWMLLLLNRATDPIVDTFANIDGTERMRIDAPDATGIKWNKWDSTHVRTQWNATTNAWATPDVYALSPAIDDDYYVIGFEVDGANQQWRLLGWHQTTTGAYDFNQGYRLFAITDWVTFASQEATADLWLTWGFIQTDAAVSGEFRYEWIRYATGAKVHAWVNQRTSGGSWNIKHWYAYDGDYEFFVPQDRTTVAIPVGGAGAWDELHVKPGSFVQDGSTYYGFYGGANAAGTFQIGLATATNLDGPWTKDAGNPIVTRVAGGNEDQVFTPFVVKDESEGDSNKRWKMVYVGFSATDSKWRLFYATASAPAGPWTKQGVILSPGGAGAWDEFGQNDPVVFWENGQWEVWHSGNATGTAKGWAAGRAYGPDLPNLTKDTTNNPYIPRQADALQAISADLTTRTASMASTTGFVADAPVVVDDTVANGDRFTPTRIRKVVVNSSLELYHDVNGFTLANSATIFQYDAGSIAMGDIVFARNRWNYFITPFAIAGQHATIDAGLETTGLMISVDLLTKPKTWQWLATPPISTGSWNNERSCENPKLLHQPTDRSRARPEVVQAREAVRRAATW